MIMIAPSILSADFARLGEDCESTRRAGADILHFDVMDGMFVPNISFGIPVLDSLNRYTDMPIDVHLMIENPKRYVERFAAAGADYITIHVEAEPEVEQTLKMIRSAGAKPSICIKPNTPASDIFKYLPLCDMVLVMSVEPGFGGQSFMPSALGKITDIRRECDKLGFKNMHIEVDGGINADTGRQVIDAGADVLVAGSALFKAADRAAFVNDLKSYKN